MKINFVWDQEEYFFDGGNPKPEYIELPDGDCLRVLEWKNNNPSKCILVLEKAPPGWSATVKAMKKHKDLSKGKTKDGKKKNPFALAWYLKNKGAKSHYKMVKGKPKKFEEWLVLKESGRNILPAPIRKKILSLISHPNFETYWDKPGMAITEITKILDSFGISVAESISFNDALEVHAERYSLLFNGQQVDNMLVFSWFKFPTGRYEINAYIS